jgi:hypothetical protein
VLSHFATLLNHFATVFIYFMILSAIPEVLSCILLQCLVILLLRQPFSRCCQSFLIQCSSILQNSSLIFKIPLAIHSNDYRGLAGRRWLAARSRGARARGGSCEGVRARVTQSRADAARSWSRSSIVWVRGHAGVAPRGWGHAGGHTGGRWMAW